MKRTLKLLRLGEPSGVSPRTFQDRSPGADAARLAKSVIVDEGRLMETAQS